MARGKPETAKLPTRRTTVIVAKRGSFKGISAMEWPERLFYNLRKKKSEGAIF
jgi:hypothetical protein